MFSSLILALPVFLSFSIGCYAVPVAAVDVSDVAPSPLDSGPYTGGVATYFYQNGVAGACGQVHSDSDFICALDQARYDPSLCGRQIQITNTQNGNTVTVIVADDCPTCQNENSLDLSTGAFSQLADLSAGVVPISWDYI